VFIFGSKARGDDKKYSDIDLLVLTNKVKTDDDRWELSDFASDINVNHGVALNCRYFNENDWDSGENVNPLFKANVEKDAIEIVL
jgi:predicted nucleotidyltransferase